MRIFFSIAISAGALNICGCGGGGSSGRESLEKSQADDPQSLPERSSNFLKVAEDEFKGFSKSNRRHAILVDEQKILNYFGFPNTDMHLLSARDYTNEKIKVYEGPFMAQAPKGKPDLAPGLYFRIWQNYECGEVLGIFEIDDAQYVVDVLMSDSTEWSKTRYEPGPDGKLELGRNTGECAHINDLDKYLQPEKHIGTKSRLYQLVINDIESVTDKTQRVAALTTAMVNMALIVSEHQLFGKIAEFWNKGEFAKPKNALNKIAQVTDYKFRNLDPRIVVVTLPEEDQYYQ